MSASEPYLVFLADAADAADASLGNGVAHWRPEACVGQLRFANCKIDTGLPDMDIRQAVSAGARGLLIGTNATDGGIKADWISTLADALGSGLDLVSGLREPLDSIPRLTNAAIRNGRRLVDLRRVPEEITPARCRPRGGHRLLTVGTDSRVGKMYTALALHAALRKAGIPATFRATGVAGIVIAGPGIVVDATPSDSIVAAAEMLTPDNETEHWDVVEGQGALLHPTRSPVTLGLISGARPDALVLCHEAGRTCFREYPDIAIPALPRWVRSYERAARLTDPAATVFGISVATHRLAARERLAYFSQVENETGLPCIDPLLTGVGALLDALSGVPAD